MEARPLLPVLFAVRWYGGSVTMVSTLLFGMAHMTAKQSP